MPAIVKSPQLEPLHTPEPVRPPGGGDDEHGSGGRPPTGKLTGGGGSGDGDEWNEQPAGQRGPRERLTTARIGVASALLGIAMLFIALISTFMVTKSSYHVNAYNRVINEWLPTAMPAVLWLNSAVLLLSSATAEFARRAMFEEQDVMQEWLGLGRPTSRRAGRWLMSTLALGLLFLAGQWMAWVQLRAQHVFYGGSTSGKLFYVLTGVHAFHLVVGLIALVRAMAVLRASRQLATRQLWVDTTVWYWHAMGVLWLMLFVLLEFFQ